MKRLATLLVLLGLVTVPALATIRYESQTSSGSDSTEETVIVVEGWVDGERTKVLFRKSENPWMKQGFYLVSTDGGKTMYMVDPEKETYSEWDIELVLRFAGAVMQGMGPLLNFKIENARVDLVSEGPGEAMHGMQTKRYVFDSEYDLLMRIMGIKKAQHIETQSTIWTTNAVGDVAMGVWLRRDPPQIGYEEFDNLARSAWGRTEGFTVRMDSTSTSTGKKGKSETTWSKFLVTALDQSAGDPPNGYGWPDHYTQVNMMPTEAELSGQPGETEGEDGKKKKKKRFGLFDGGS